MSTVPPDPQGQPAYTPPPADASSPAPAPAEQPAPPAYPGSSDPADAPPAHAGSSDPAYAAPTSSGASETGYAPPAAPATPNRKGLGLIAFLAAVVAVVAGSILTYLAGVQSGSLAEYGIADGTSSSVNSLPPEGQQRGLVGGLLLFAGYAVMGAFGLWGLIQGIIAAVKNRGRGWGIAAIIVAVLAALPVTIFFFLGIAAGIAPYVS